MADNWSLGVVLYVMLSGVPPFYGRNNKEILKSVLRGVYTFNLKPFKTCSDEVKDLISKLLVRTPEKRFSAINAYNHPWVQQQVDQESKNIVISTEVINNLGMYMEYKAFKKTILYMIAGQLPEEDVKEFRDVSFRILPIIFSTILVLFAFIGLLLRNVLTFLVDFHQAGYQWRRIPE